MLLNRGRYMYNQDYLRHYGILGMHWGKRKGTTIADINKIARKNDKLKTKIVKTERKVEKNRSKISTYTKRLERNKFYFTEWGKARNERNAWRLGRRLRTDTILKKRIARLEKRIIKNQTLMNTQLKDIPKDQIKLAKSIVEAALKN
jgi:hypothetical protein